MKVVLFIVLVLAQALISSTSIAYDRNDVMLEQLLNNISKNTKATPKPVLNDSKALYELKNIQDVHMATTLSMTLNGIKNNNINLSNYTIISPLKKQQLHIVVSKKSNYKTIYDLNNRNINIAQEKNSVDIFTLALESRLNLVFNQQYNDTQVAINNMLQGGGIDAVIFSDEIPSNYLKKYKNHIRLINLPAMKGFKRTTINKASYSQENDTVSIETDLLLIGTTTYVDNNPSVVHGIIKNVFSNTKASSICGSNYIVKINSYQKAYCKKNITTSSKGNTKVKAINLIQKISSVEDIKIFTYALMQNKKFGGLSKKTELQKVNKLYKYYKDEDANTKVIIKYYFKDKISYKGAKKIFKLLKKKGVARGNMIMKSFNKNDKCTKEMDVDCKYLHAKIKFEFL